MTMLGLDLFCGAGGITKGWQRAGFKMLGVDIDPQPNYPGDWFVQADVLSLSPEFLRRFDVICATPPCQLFVQGLKNFPNPPNEILNLIPATRALLTKAGVPWVMENIPGAPLRPDVRLGGWMFPELKVIRERWFECSFPIDTPAYRKPRGLLAKGFLSIAGNGTQKYCVDRGYRRATIANCSDAMGIDWMTRAEISQAIPPAYAEFIARAFLAKRARAAA